jgi:hypothetical protein
MSAGKICKAVSLLLTLGSVGCASTVWNSYPGGTLKYSEIKYNYTARPIVATPSGATYMLRTEGLSVTSVPALEKAGMKLGDSGADFMVFVKTADVKHEPGAMGSKGKYKGVLMSTLPIKIEVRGKNGKVLLDRKMDHQEILTLDGDFKSKKDATDAVNAVAQMSKPKLEQKLKGMATDVVKENLETVAKGLLEPRELSVALPAVRSAGNVDMESSYLLLADAKNDDQVRAALEAYSAVGAEHKNPDGTADVVANYGVMCAFASAKILSGDLAGAWSDTKTAWGLMPQGKEHRLIIKVLRDQEKRTGVEIIPKGELEDMENAEKDDMKKQMKNIFGG